MHSRTSGIKIKHSIVTTGPAIEPISIEDVAKVNLKLEEEDVEEDGLIALLIQAAREDIEIKTGKSLITQSREIKLDQFPNCDTIELTFGPVQTVTEINYYNSNDELQILASSEYWVDTHSPIARVVIKNSWPATKTRPNAVTIEYTAGYGDVQSDVPAPLKSACLVALAWLYENRDQAVPHDLVDTLIGPYVTTQDVSY